MESDRLRDVATIIVINENSEILILQRSKQSRGGGLWNFPGGSVEEGEEFNTAAVRELFEEANLVVDESDAQYIGHLITKYLKVHFYITDEWSGEVEINPESDDYEWVSLDELDNYKFVGGGSIHPGIINFINNYINA